MLLTSSADFKKLFRQAYDNLNPGGWFEIQDASLPLGIAPRVEALSICEKSADCPIQVVTTAR